MFSEEICDKGLSPADTWKKNFRMPKGDFEALIAELRP